MAGDTYTFGLSGQQADFQHRNARFFEILPGLQQHIVSVCERQFIPVDAAQTVMFTLGRLAVEDFMEVMLVCGNGYGSAGLKLLTPMYEAVVTALYISRNPDEARLFLDYHHVHQMKVLNIAANTGVDLSQLVSPSERQEIESGFQAVQHNYRQACPKCGADRPLNSWTKKDLGTMARDVGMPGSSLWLGFWPTLHIHTTPTRLIVRLEETPEGIAFMPGPQPLLADKVLLGAHVCLDLMLADQNRYFELGLEDLERALTANFTHAWHRPHETKEEKRDGQTR